MPTLPTILLVSLLALASPGEENEVGSSYCSSTPNSTGAPAHLSGHGSASVSANDLVLRARPVPRHKYGIFYYGPTSLELPFADGYRCVGSGGLGSFLLPPTRSYGSYFSELAVDLDSPPREAGRILPGSRWFFQLWFRDPAAGQSGSNLSDGLAIDFVL